MGDWLAPEFSERDKHLVTLVAESLAPLNLKDPIMAAAFGDPQHIARLKELGLPSMAWLQACVEVLTDSAKGIAVLEEGFEYLGADSDPMAIGADAWVFAGAVLDRDFAIWAVERLSDNMAYRIIDLTGNQELADDALDQIDVWSNNLTFAAIRSKFLELAKSGPRNSSGQTCEEVLVASGLLEQNDEN